MAIVTASEWDGDEQHEFLVDIGNGREVLCRRPDLQYLVLKGILPTPLLSEVITLISKWMGSSIQSLDEEVIAKSDQLLDFVDTLVCECVVQPRVVREHPQDGEMLLSRITVTTKKAICVAISNSLAPPAVVAAASDFPEQRHGEGAGPDVQAVRPEAVVGVGDA